MSDTTSLQRDDGKITVRLPAIVVERLDEVARRQGVGRSELVREALNAYVRENGAALAEPSLYDVLQSAGFVGRFAAPPSLSTTPKAELRRRIQSRSVDASSSTRPRRVRRAK